MLLNSSFASIAELSTSSRGGGKGLRPQLNPATEIRYARSSWGYGLCGSWVGIFTILSWVYIFKVTAAKVWWIMKERLNVQ